jgi:hypothetical protein
LLITLSSDGLRQQGTEIEAGGLKRGDGWGPIRKNRAAARLLYNEKKMMSVI